MLGDRFILSFEMEYGHDDDIPAWVKQLGWNFGRPIEEVICVTDFDNNEWIIETGKILGWKVDFNEVDIDN